jgi:hypothetical protein
MSPSFFAYVDESGDEGFVFNADGSGSSRWFVLSAAVIRRTNDLEMVRCLKEVRTVLQKAPKTPLHFVDLKHEQRVPYIRRVGELPLRTVSVLIYKPLIREPEKFQNTKYLLYRYATRLLLERVSWLCREQRRTGEGDGFCEVIFSNRSNMSYDEIRDYLRLLLQQSEANPQEVQISFGVSPRYLTFFAFCGFFPIFWGQSPLFNIFCFLWPFSHARQECWLGRFESSIPNRVITSWCVAMG